MAELKEKQWELEGVVFGLDAPVAVTNDGWTPGSSSIRTSDAPQPSGDGIRMGRDFKGASTWSFSMFANQRTEDEAWAAIGPLAAAWDDEEVRTTAGRVVPLRYRLAGKTRRVYGRPRRWTVLPTNLSMQGRLDVEADFETVDHRFYDDELQTKPILLAAPIDEEAVDTGFDVPFIAPVVSNSNPFTRNTTVTIGGDVPTPIILTFEEIEDARVDIGGWSAGLLDPVTLNNPVTIDGRPWVRSATQANGGGVRVSPRITRISKMWLPPGEHEVTLTGTDRTGRAKVLVSWANAYRTPR